jgi:hypothetical protein
MFMQLNKDKPSPPKKGWKGGNMKESVMPFLLRNQLNSPKMDPQLEEVLQKARSLKAEALVV